MSKVRVLVTRPEGQRDRLIEVLAQAQIDSQCLPMLALSALHEPADEQAIELKLSRLAEQQLAIFISSNAVRFAAEKLAALSLAWPSQLPCMAIGATTAKAIENQGWPQYHDSEPMDLHQPPTSEGLLAKAALQSIAGQKVMIFRGRGGRELLAEQLQARGAMINYCELYQRHQPAYDASTVIDSCGLADGGQPVAAILFASGETLSNFCHHIQDGQLPNRIFDIAVVVPSPRIYDLAQAAGFNRIHLAANASAEGFLAALQAHIVV